MSRRARWGLSTALLLLACAAAGTASRAAATADSTPGAAEPVGGIAYEGDDRSTLRLAPALAPAVEEYGNAGYRLRRGAGGGEVIVEVSLAPLASRAPFVAPGDDGAEAGGPEEKTARGAGEGGAAAGRGGGPTGDAAGAVGAAARAAVAGAETVHQAVTGVLGWIVHNVSASEDHASALGAASAAPAQVLEAGAGDAAAVARLAVEMLGAVGIEARTVRGRVVGPPRPGAPRGRHVWIEVRYPDRGWVFSDPLHHHHYVPASYLRLSEAGSEADAAAPDSVAGAAELVERDDRRVAVDVYRAGGPGVGARRNDGRQVAAALRVVVPGAAEGAAVLTAADGSKRRRALLGGEGVFVGLAGGAYTLEVLVPGRTGLSRALELAPRERSAVYFGGEAAAQREPAAERSPPPPVKQPGHARRVPR